MPLSLVCGAECQIHSNGSGAAADSHWSNLGGTVTVVSSPVRSGSFAYSLASTGADYGTLIHTAAAAAGVAYARFYFRMADVTPTAELPIMRFQVFGTGQLEVVVTTSGVLRLVDGSGMVYSSTNDLTLAVDTWYGVEVEYDNTSGAKWRVWDGDWSSSESLVQPGSACDEVMIGVVSPTIVHTVYMDDIAIGFGTTAGELYDDTGTNGRSSHVEILRPTSDGTHSFTTGDFKYDSSGGSDISPSATDVYSHLDAADMEQTSEGVYASSGAETSDYVEVHFGDLAGKPLAVSIVRHMDAQSTGTIASVSDDGSNWAGLASASIATNQYLQEVLASAPSGASWSTALVNGMRAQLKSSATVSDEYYGVALEVEIEDAANIYARPISDVATTGWSTTPLWSKVDDDPDSPDGTVVSASV